MKIAVLVVLGLVFGTLAEAKDCSKIPARLKCAGSSFKANPTQVKEQVPMTATTVFMMRETGEMGEEYCSARVEFGDATYGIEFDAEALENGQLQVSIHKSGTNMRATTHAFVGLGSKITTVLGYEAPIEGVDADQGFKIFQSTFTCELIAR